MNEWQAFILAAVSGLILWKLHSIDLRLGAILVLLRRQAGVDEDDE